MTILNNIEPPLVPCITSNPPRIPLQFIGKPPPHTVAGGSAAIEKFHPDEASMKFTFLKVTDPGRGQIKLLGGAKPSELRTMLQATRVYQVSPGTRPEMRRRGITDHQTLSKFPKSLLKKGIKAIRSMAGVDAFIKKLETGKNEFCLENLFFSLYNPETNQVILRPIPSLRTPANLILNSFV